ncbi:MAG: oligosaccharide flippase family protein [bacterium]
MYKLPPDIHDQSGSKDQSEGTHFSEVSKIVKGGGISLIGSLGAKGMLFLLALFIAKALGPSDIGLYFLGITICEVLTLVSIMGLPNGITRYVAIYNERNDIQRMKGTVLGAALCSLLVSLLSGALLFLSADLISSLLHKPALAPILKLFAVSIPFECLMKIFTASTRGLKIMEHTAAIEQISWIGLRLGLALLFFYGMNTGLGGVILAYVIASFICASLAFYYANRWIPLINTQIPAVFEARKLLKFSLPMLLSTLIHDIMMKEDVVMLGYFVSAAEVGIYSVAVKVLNLAEVIFQTFRPIFNPMVAELQEKKELTRLGHLLKLITRWDVIVSCPLFLSLFLFPEFFLSIFGKGFIGGSVCLRILIAASVFNAISSYPDSIIFMSGRSEITLMNGFIALITNFIINYLLIPSQGIKGAALATAAALLIVALLRILILFRMMKIQPLSTSLWKPLMAGSTSFFITYLMHRLTMSNAFHINYTDYRNIIVLFLLSFFMVSYSSLIYLFKFNKEEIYIKEKIKKKILILINS